MDRFLFPAPERKPPWLKISLREGDTFRAVRDIVHERALHTVCEEARCPNRHECWNAGTATFMILGDTCTRACGFCAVKTGRPLPVDGEEPARVAESVALLGLKYAVITSVDRDDLPDLGAGHFVATIRAIRDRCPEVGVEVLTPDFQGRAELIERVAQANPAVFAHNLETVPRISRLVRRQSRHERSIAALRLIAKRCRAKTGLMLGLGETDEEVAATLREAREVGVAILTLGQYLQPTRAHAEVRRYVTPDEFARWGDFARELGFEAVEAAPLSRSSYHAERAGAGVA